MAQLDDAKLLKILNKSGQVKTQSNALKPLNDDQLMDLLKAGKTTKDLGQLATIQLRSSNYTPPDLSKEAQQKVYREQLKKQGPTQFWESSLLGMADIGAPVVQGFSWLGDKVSTGINAVAGTNLDTNSYERVTKGLKEANDAHNTVREGNKQGMDVVRLGTNIAFTTPLAATGGTLKAGTALSSAAGREFLARNAALGGLIGATGIHENNAERVKSMVAGAAGGAIGGIAAKGIDKVSQNAAKKVMQKATQKNLDAPVRSLANNARQAGYSLPPSYTNPNFINKSLAKIAGEADLARIASAKNQQVTNNLARKSIGLPEDQPITLEALGSVRQEAGQAYNVLKSLGQVKTDRRFAKDINDITKTYISAGRDFAVKGGDRIQNVVSQVQGNKFGADAALDMIKIARSEASVAFRAGDTDLGLANQKLANAIESQLERAVIQNTQVPRAAVQNFVNARKVIAKTYSIENALDASGNVSARKLASTLGKKPLSGELKQAAEFSQIYPQLNNVGVHGGNGITLFDGIMGVGGGAATGNPGVAALALARPALKAGLSTSFAGKTLGTPSYNSKLMEALIKANILSPITPVAGANIGATVKKSN